nr:hypothetical protein [uncultured Sphingobacterium sp.]
MEFNELKATWNTVKTPQVSPNDIKKMLSENNHPVLKRIRKQLTIEIIGWSMFLVCYYTMFDGEQKPIWINMLLVIAILSPIIHSLMGYRFSKYLVWGSNIQEMLKNYLSKVKTYGITSIILRQIYLIGLLIFFSYGLSFNSNRYIVMSVVALIGVIQLVITCRLWKNRVNDLRNSFKSFH